MNLYQIDAEIMNCIDLETGEIIDAEKLEALQMERGQKIENVALWVKNLKADMAAYKAEKEAFAEREKQAKAKIESLSKWLVDALSGERFSTNKVAVSFRNSEAVSITDEAKIPKKYFRVKIEKAPDKTLIKEAIKNGLKVRGAELVAKQNIQIK